MKHLCIHVTGNVQGVFFRASTKKIADEFGIKGFVRNEPDGSVYMEAEGNEKLLEKFTDWCWQGPPHAMVKHLTISEGELKGFTSFEINR